GCTGIGAFRVVTECTNDCGIGSRMAAESDALSEIVSTMPARRGDGDGMKSESPRIELNNEHRSGSNAGLANDRRIFVWKGAIQGDRSARSVIGHIFALAD